MTSLSSVAVSLHDEPPAVEAALVDAGLTQSNSEAAPLNNVRPLSCFAWLSSGEVIGGAIGRTWGQCCELRQLWVHPNHRRKGVATLLISTFEAGARERGCTNVYLDTFSFMAPSLYLALGYETKLSITGFAPGIVKHTMVKHFTDCKRSGT